MKLKQENLNLSSLDRFDLEQAIMQLWMIADDIDTLYKYFYERHEDMTVDDMANALLGLKQMAHMRGELAFEIFENMVKKGGFNEPRNATPFGQGAAAYEGSN